MLLLAVLLPDVLDGGEDTDLTPEATAGAVRLLAMATQTDEGAAALIVG